MNVRLPLNFDQMLAHAGIDLPTRQAMLSAAIAAKGDQGEQDRRPSISAISDSLKKLALPAETHAAVLKHLVSDGLAANDGVDDLSAASAGPLGKPILTPLQAAAANPQNAILIHQLAQRCSRLGYQLELDRRVDQFKLDQALAGKDVTSRLEIKTTMARLHLLP